MSERRSGSILPKPVMAAAAAFAMTMALTETSTPVAEARSIPGNRSMERAADSLGGKVLAFYQRAKKTHEGIAKIKKEKGGLNWVSVEKTVPGDKPGVQYIVSVGADMRRAKDGSLRPSTTSTVSGTVEIRPAGQTATEFASSFSIESTRENTPARTQRWLAGARIRQDEDTYWGVSTSTLPGVFDPAVLGRVTYEGNATINLARNNAAVPQV